MKDTLAAWYAINVEASVVSTKNIIIIAVLYVGMLITAENSIMRRLPVAHELMYENLSVSYATISNCYLKNLLIYLNLKNILLYNLQC